MGSGLGWGLARQYWVARQSESNALTGLIAGGILGGLIGALGGVLMSWPGFVLIGIAIGIALGANLGHRIGDSELRISQYVEQQPAAGVPGLNRFSCETTLPHIREEGWSR